MRPRHSIHNILPWILVKDSIEPWDLVTHATLFSLSISTTNILYGTVTRRTIFWEEMCIKNGLGLLPGEDPEQLDWEQVVLECAKDAWTCDHPECGKGRLLGNGVCTVPGFHDVAVH